MIFLNATVISLAVLQTAGAPQILDVKTDHDAYAVYAMVLQPQPDNARNSKGPILLQAETEWWNRRCSESLARMSGEWAEAADNFRRENSRVRLLQTGVPMPFEYRLVNRADIWADDARLAAKDPRQRNAPRPGSIKYIAVSAVGFNAARTKALVYVRFRTTEFADALVMTELKDGKWAILPGGCSGLA